MSRRGFSAWGGFWVEVNSAQLWVQTCCSTWTSGAVVVGLTCGRRLYQWLRIYLASSSARTNTYYNLAARFKKPALPLVSSYLVLTTHVRVVLQLTVIFIVSAWCHTSRWFKGGFIATHHQTSAGGHGRCYEGLAEQGQKIHLTWALGNTNSITVPS
ncbi:uncharacterized protein YALI1_F22504g [Yarrowia lipolytica]|uniref:Uncharacterized protein n=1 Tax=Yarrowia lipolytica TaxID=4952 RepID=A0A1D8NNT2_YARLL|nr:hypothetical protein YALI1_F22504g [Yarrowia lipolytica]